MLLVCTSFTAAHQFAVNRNEKGDMFFWYDTDIDCGRFSSNTAYQPFSSNASLCHCDSKLTFSTEDNKCRSYRNQSKAILMYM